MKVQLLLTALFGKYRYQTNQGLLNGEQLTTVSMNVLEQLYQDLQLAMPKVKTLSGKKVDNTLTQNKLRIVEAIYNYRVELAKMSLKDRSNKALQAKLFAKADIQEIKELTNGKTAKEIRKAAAKL